MGKNKNATKSLTQEEIWDDSALVQSWDEAVEEYKLYHSIQARGENVEDALREAEAAGNAEVQNPVIDTDHDDMSTDPGPSMVMAETAQHNASQDTGEPIAHPTYLQTDVDHTTTHGSGVPAIPQVALAQVQDESLKNLMMAWYYAGYYSGLYEGQQRVNIDQAKKS